VVAALGLAWVQVRPNLGDHLAGAPQGASVAPVARCAWFSAAHAAAPSFSPGAARSGIARGPVPSRPVIPGPTHLPWEGRSTAHALDLEPANAARDRSAEIPSVGAAPLVTTGRSPREVPSICRLSIPVVTVCARRVPGVPGGLWTNVDQGAAPTWSNGKRSQD
jgi:hypothetical protein